jgi:hypothetical protein
VGILRGVGFQSLPCGCLIGFYETYAGKTVAILDARGSTCEDPNHRTNRVLQQDVPIPQSKPGQVTTS